MALENRPSPMTLGVGIPLEVFSMYIFQYSVVKFWDKRMEPIPKKHLFFIFFEWKNNVIEESHLVYTTTPWSIGAGLCGVFLMLHR